MLDNFRLLFAKREGGEVHHLCPRDERLISYLDCVGCEHFKRVWRERVLWRVECLWEVPDVVQIQPCKVWTEKELRRPFLDIFNVDSRWSWATPLVDGMRVLVHFRDGGVVVTGRRRDRYGLFEDLSDKLVHLVDGVDFNLLDGVVVDGWLVAGDWDDLGGLARSKLGGVMRVRSSGVENALVVQEELGYLHIWLWDLLFSSGGEDFRQLGFGERRLELERLFSSGGFGRYFRLLDGFFAGSEYKRRSLLAKFREMGFGGLLLRNILAFYGESYGILQLRERIKLTGIVSGWSYGREGTRFSETLGVLHFSVRDCESGELVEVVKLAPRGEREREKFFRMLRDLDSEETLALNLVGEIEGRVWTSGGRLRSPSFIRWLDLHSIEDISCVNFSEVIV